MIRKFTLLVLLLATSAVGSQPPTDPTSFDQRDDVRAFVNDMTTHYGFDADELLARFRKVKPSPSVLKAIQPPAPGTRSWQAYRARFVEPKRITRGIAFWQDHAASLARAEALYGVPAEIIVAIIGVETFYGRHTGGFDTFNALATLAFDYPPRAQLFRGELEALLLLARDEGRDPWNYRGSFAGALGLPQFLPSSIRGFGVDFDRDGHIDLASSADDAIGSVASFLFLHGWETGHPITLPVKVSRGDTASLLAEGILPKRLPREMSEIVDIPDDAPAEGAALIDLPTPSQETEYRLGFNNFYVLTRYNRSTFYASAVTDLAATLREARASREAPAVSAQAGQETAPR